MQSREAEARRQLCSFITFVPSLWNTPTVTSLVAQYQAYIQIQQYGKPVGGVLSYATMRVVVQNLCATNASATAERVQQTLQSLSFAA